MDLCSLLKLNYAGTSPEELTNPGGDEINSPPIKTQSSAETDQCTLVYVNKERVSARAECQLVKDGVRSWEAVRCQWT